MTPLAHRIAKELTLPVPLRSFIDRHGLLRRLDDVHCFEVTQVLDAAADLTSQFYQDASKIDRLSFLPAPKTWVEWVSEGVRVGVLMEEVRNELGEQTRADLIFAVCSARAGEVAEWGTSGHGYIDLCGTLRPGGKRGAGFIDIEGIETTASERIQRACHLHALLALINTPRIIGRSTHTPHSGLQRALARSRGMVGKFPLHAWTEIKLSINPPPLSPGDDEIHLTGAKALHFVRCHLRVRLGKLELVSAHWRGDPALGIKQSRYVVSGRA